MKEPQAPHTHTFHSIHFIHSFIPCYLLRSIDGPAQVRDDGFYSREMLPRSRADQSFRFFSQHTLKLLLLEVSISVDQLVDVIKDQGFTH